MTIEQAFPPRARAPSLFRDHRRPSHLPVTTLTVASPGRAHTGSMQPAGAIDVLYQPTAGTCSSPEAALREMDEAGVAVACVAPCTQLTCERQWACAESRLEDVARFLRASTRFTGLCGYNPFDAPESLREIDAARAFGFRGVFVQLSAFGLPLRDARYYPLFAKAAEVRMPALVESSASEPVDARTLRRIARDFPELDLAVAVPEADREVLRVAADWDRISLVLRTAGLTSLCRRHAELVSDTPLGERCMWGSGGESLRQALTGVRELPLPDVAMTGILRANALRFFANPLPPQPARSLDPSIIVAEN